MKIPPRVRIKRGVVYEVVFIDQFKDPDQLGECRFNEKQIVLLSKQSDKSMRESFWHECVHAIENEWGICLKHKDIYVLEKALERLFSLNRFVL